MAKKCNYTVCIKLYLFFLYISEVKKPGPADYSVTNTNLKQSPKYTCRSKVKTSYPDSVTYDKGKT